MIGRKKTGLLCLILITLIGLSATIGYAGEDPGPWRLFDPAPTAQPEGVKTPTGIHSRPEKKRALTNARTYDSWLVFNGVISSSSQQQAADGRLVETVWINNYPYQASEPPPGVKQLKWHKALQLLVVELSNGAIDHLSPGERMQLAPPQ